MNAHPTKWMGLARARLAELMPTLPSPLRPLLPHALWAGNPAWPEIALTFDDGPDGRDTPQLLAVLARHAVRATFFCIGERAEVAPHLLQAAAAAGHEHGIHGYYHRPFPLERPDDLRRQLATAQAVIAEATGRSPQAVVDVRPPYGVFTSATLRRLSAWGYRTVLWTLAPLHWLQSSEDTTRQLVRQTGPGSVLVLHEGLGGPPVHELVEAALPRLLGAGYRFVTVSEMWRSLGEDRLRGLTGRS